MKERKRSSVLQSARADGDGMRRPPGHLIMAAGREEVLRKGGGEEATIVRCMCDMSAVTLCAAHADAFLFYYRRLRVRREGVYYIVQEPTATG